MWIFTIAQNWANIIYDHRYHAYKINIHVSDFQTIPWYVIRDFVGCSIIWILLETLMSMDVAKNQALIVVVTSKTSVMTKFIVLDLSFIIRHNLHPDFENCAFCPCAN